VFVRGAEKKVIHLKNTGSNIFSEAYFIVSEGVSNSRTQIKDMLSEADRIIDESISRESTDRRELGRKILRFILPFLLGVILTLSAAILVSLLF
jgi:hypothetical protein